MTSHRATKVAMFAAVAALSLFLPSCQVATPASRIAENPALYDSLPEHERGLVQQGQIRQGMSAAAVFLAWGYPNSRPFVGEKEGKHLERWLYTSLEPVVVTPAWRGCVWYDDCGPSMDVAYIPRNTACVTFENGRVVSWEARR